MSKRAANLLGLLACVGLMGYALFVQYGLGLEPCPLCILQRIAVIGLGVLFGAAALHAPALRGARLYGLLLALVAVLGSLVSMRHMWIIAQPPGTVAECGASLEYMLDVLAPGEVLLKILRGSGECANIDWGFLGLNMPAWVLISLLTLGAFGLAVNWASGPVRRLRGTWLAQR